MPEKIVRREKYGQGRGDFLYDESGTVIYCREGVICLSDRKFGKGLFVGIVVGFLVPFLILITMFFFNIANVGNLIRTMMVLDGYSLHSLSSAEKAEGAIAGMVEELDDPYSLYLSAEDFSEMMEDFSGSYEGLGFYLANTEDSDYTIILAPIKDTPAFKAGLQAGDEIMTINGESMLGVNADEISAMVKRGEESHFVIEVLRNGETISVELDREEINIPTVEGQFLEGSEGIAYLSISTFNETTPKELEDTIASLEKEGNISGILLDLRNNGGGSVTAVTDIADDFLTPGDHIFWIEEKRGETVVDDEESNPYAYPMVVLVNGYSASASEILSGALKDNGRARIVGETTYGKGVIQTIYRLADGAGLKVTTAEYYSPDKHKVHEVGVEPDVVEELNSDDITVIYSLDPEKDNQLKKAIEVLKSEM